MLWHVARRPARRGDRAQPGRPPVLRRLAVPPGVQVAPGASGAAVPRIRRRGARSRRRGRAGTSSPARPTPATHRPHPRCEARHRRGARAAARDVRDAVPDREPVGPRARVRRLGDRGARADRAGGGGGRRRARCRLGRWQPAGADPGRRGRDHYRLGRQRHRGDAAQHPLCAHLDTVPLAAPVEPVVVNAGWENANEAILGADNKAAVAVMLELARRLVSGAAAAGRPRAAVHRLRGGVAARLARVRHRAAAQPVRLRVRPRHTDRRDRARLPDPLPDRRRAARAPRRTPGSSPSRAAARSPRPSPRSRRCGSAAWTRRRPRTSARSRGAARST